MTHLLLSLRLAAVALLVLCDTSNGYSQSPQTVTGYVYSELGEPVQFAQVAGSGDSESYALSDESGAFSLRTDSDSLRITALLYRDTVMAVSALGNTKRVALRPINLRTAYVTAQRGVGAAHAYRMAPAQLSSIPALGGEVDVYRSVHALPGVSGQSEGTATVGIRGAEPSQTLVLLDGAPLFAPAVFFGYQGGIHYATVRDVVVYTGGYPVEMGGRIGGVMEVNTRRGSGKGGHKREGGVGFPNLTFAAEGPLRNTESNSDTSGSYFFAARGTYLGAFLAISGDHFYQGDAMAKINLRRRRGYDISISLYGNLSAIGARKDTDNLEPGDLTGYSNLSLNLYASKLLPSGVSSFRFVSGQYRTFLNGDFIEAGQADEPDVYTVKQANLFTRSAATYVRTNTTGWANTKFGGELELNRYVSKVSEFINSSRERSGSSLPLHSSVTSGFGAAQVPIGSVLELDVGLRVSWLRSFADDYDASWVEPRLGVSAALNSTSSIALAYDRMSQTQLVFGSLTSGGGTFEQFLPPTNATGVPKSNQISAIYRKRSRSESRIEYNASLSVYYRSYRELSSTVVDGVVGRVDPLDIERFVTSGSGRSWGVDVFGSVAFSGLTSARVSYSLGRSLRTFPEINRGSEYPYRWERPHVLSMVASHRMSHGSAWTVSGMFTYESGYPYSYPDAAVFTGVARVPQFTLHFSEINNVRAKAHHRVDLAAEYEYYSHRGRKRLLRFSLYNAYARANPSASFVAIERDLTLTASPDGQPVVSVDGLRLSEETRSIFRAVPGVQYTFEF